MRYVIWILRLAIFVVVLLFALKNTAPVDVAWFADQVITEVPLIVVMLVAVLVGAVLGVLLTLPSVVRTRRESARLRRELVQANEAAQQAGRAVPPASATEVSAPMTPI